LNKDYTALKVDGENMTAVEETNQAEKADSGAGKDNLKHLTRGSRICSEKIKYTSGILKDKN
jgi:hypothetical protein